MKRQPASSKVPAHFYYVEYSYWEECVVAVCFLLCLLFIAVFYGIESLYGNSGNPGVPYIAEVGVRYNLIDPLLFVNMMEYLK
jgi:hypothetical protein